MVHRRKPAGRPKSVMTENLDIGGMHNEWDGCEAIRTRLRNGEDLLVGKINEDIPSLVANIEILQPLITRMSLTATRPLPAVDAWGGGNLYCKQERSDSGGPAGCGGYIMEDSEAFGFLKDEGTSSWSLHSA